MATPRFGPYELIECLGRGGMAEVWRARRHDGTETCIKRLRPEVHEVAGVGRLLLDEGRIASRLSHPRVVKIHRAGEVSGTAFLEMDLVAGRDLARLLERLRDSSRPLPTGITVHVAAATLAGLAHAHDLGIIHRDVSPQNILLGWDGQVLLGDFGIARVREHARSTLRDTEGALAGKTAYLSPERLRQSAGNARSDLFSLGVVVWEALAGERLFGGAGISPGEAANRVLTMPAPRLAHAPDAVADWVAGLLHKDPARRPPSAQAAARTLGEVARTLYAPVPVGSETLVAGDLPAGLDAGLEQKLARQSAELLHRVFRAERLVAGQAATAKRPKKTMERSESRARGARRGGRGPRRLCRRGGGRAAPPLVDDPGSTPARADPGGAGAHWLWWAAAGGLGILALTAAVGATTCFGG